MNPLGRTPAWLTAHWRGAAVLACAIGALATFRWKYDQGPERRARLQEKELQGLAEKISQYAQEMQTRYPTGSVVVSVKDLARQLRRGPEKISVALDVLQSQRKAERVPLAGYWRLNA